jgi:hypothetical protein
VATTQRRFQEVEGRCKANGELIGLAIPASVYALARTGAVLYIQRS